MPFKKILLVPVLLGATQFACASPSINDMQGCQAVIDFVEQRMAATQSVYSSEDVETVLKGVQAYDEYIQNDIITPGLLKYANGDKAKAKGLQEQVDAYKKGLVANLDKKFAGDRLYSDTAISLNKCAQISVPSGAALEALKASLFKIIELSKSSSPGL